MATLGFLEALGMPTRGDYDASANIFFQVSTTVIAIIGSLQVVFINIAGLDPESGGTLINDIIYNKIFAGMVVTMLFGNLYYAWMAVRLMQSTGNRDVTALPYGINTPAAFAIVFNVMMPAVAQKEGSPEEKVLHAWRVGCTANLFAGLVSTLCGFAGPHLVKLAPRASMMVSLAGIAFTWLGVNQLKDCFIAGYAGLLPLAFAILCFFGGFKTDPVPTSISIILLGSLAGWLSFQGWLDGGSWAAVKDSFGELGLHTPCLLDMDVIKDIPEVLATNSGVILPLALTGAVGTLLNVLAAKDAGDDYPLKEAMIVDGITTMVAALFGSPLGTCVFIGHPQFKAQNGRVYFAFFGAILFTIFALFGLFAVVKAFIPPYAMCPIILFIGIAINQDMFATTPRHHLPACILGLFPALCEWIKSGFPSFSAPPEIFALAQGALFIAVIWSAIAIFIIDRRFKDAIVWCLVGSVFSAIGLIHQSAVDFSFSNFMEGDDPTKYASYTAQKLARPFGTSPCAFFLGYLLVAAMLFVPLFLQMKGSYRVGPPVETEDDTKNGLAVETAFVVSRASLRINLDHASAKSSRSNSARSLRSADLELKGMNAGGGAAGV